MNGLCGITPFHRSHNLTLFARQHRLVNDPLLGRPEIVHVTADGRVDRAGRRADAAALRGRDLARRRLPLLVGAQGKQLLRHLDQLGHRDENIRDAFGFTRGLGDIQELLGILGPKHLLNLLVALANDDGVREPVTAAQLILDLFYLVCAIKNIGVDSDHRHQFPLHQQPHVRHQVAHRILKHKRLHGHRDVNLSRVRLMDRAHRCRRAGHDLSVNHGVISSDHEPDPQRVRVITQAAVLGDALVKIVRHHDRRIG